jgi:hypothetical protein
MTFKLKHQAKADVLGLQSPWLAVCLVCSLLDLPKIVVH